MPIDRREREVTGYADHQLEMDKLADAMNKLYVESDESLKPHVRRIQRETLHHLHGRRSRPERHHPGAAKATVKLPDDSSFDVTLIDIDHRQTPGLALMCKQIIDLANVGAVEITIEFPSNDGRKSLVSLANVVRWWNVESPTSVTGMALTLSTHSDEWLTYVRQQSQKLGPGHRS